MEKKNRGIYYFDFELRYQVLIPQVIKVILQQTIKLIEIDFLVIEV
jgi:hypothetical protein